MFSWILSLRGDLFLPPFLAAFALTIFFSLLFLAVPVLRGRVWRVGDRHAQKERLPRLGGVAMCLALLGAVLFDAHLVLTREIVGLLVASLVACLVGLWDDVRELSFKAQGFLQVALTVILFVFGMGITSLRNPFGAPLVFSDQSFFPVLVSFSLLLIWIVLVMNAVNWLDGLDGLLGEVSLIGFLIIFFLSLKPEVNQPPVAILAIIAVGLTAGFLFFNIHPARILAGTSGSMLLGLLIAALAVIAGTKIATALLVLSLPVADALWVIGERLRSGQSIFQPDHRHLHYKLQELGWSEGGIAWFFFLLTALIGLVALNTEALGKVIAFGLILTLIFSLLFFVDHKTRKQRLSL